MPNGSIGGIDIGPVRGQRMDTDRFRSLAIASSGMSAQRERLEVISRNIANAETTRTPDGGAYQRKVVSMRARDFDAERPGGISSLEFPELMSDRGPGGVEVGGVETDTSPGEMVYDPSHPDADENGYVEYPNVDVQQEMVDMMITRRSYEANATTFEVAKSMLQRATEI